ncbi:MAG: hypothetical protein AAGF97_12820 [Planctomycetota bacterium]
MVHPTDSHTAVSRDGHATRNGNSAHPLPSERTGRKRSVSWTLINFWVDSLLLVVFVALVWVSVVVRFVFPAAAFSEGWSLWGWTLDAWLQLQFGLLALLTFGIVVHLMLHWSWVCGVFFGRIWPNKQDKRLPDDGTRTIYGVGFMIVLLNLMGLAIAIASLSVQGPL